MKKILLASAATALCSTAAFAGGLDRSGQSLSFIFDEPGTGSFSIGRVNPSVTGSDVANPNNTYDVGTSYTQTSASGVQQINEDFSLGILYDQPFGAGINYNNDPLTSALGGTSADIESDALSFVGKYQINERVSVFGGVRAQRISGIIALNGRAYQGIADAAIAAQADAIEAGVTAAIEQGVRAAFGQGVRDQLTADGQPQALIDAATDDVVALVISDDPAEVAAVTAGLSLTLQGLGQPPAVADAQAGGLVTQTRATFDTTLADQTTANLQAGIDSTTASLVNDFLDGGNYNVDIEDDWAAGWSLGAAYEIPDIALRLAVTYNSEISHTTTATEVFGGLAEFVNDIEVVSPQSVNVEFQTGIAADTLLTGGVRWTNWGDFDVIPVQLGSDLANLDDSYRWTLGVARRFNDSFAGSIGLAYEAASGDDNVSPLGPNDGQIGLTIGGRYENDGLTVSGGINYTWLGDADAGVGGQDVASFDNNSALGLGLKVSFSF